MIGSRRRLSAAGGVQLSCIEAGPADGPLIILLHGFPEDAQSWSAQIEALAAAGHHVLAPDQRGYGDSDKPFGVAAYALDLLADDVVALAEGLGYDRFDLAGHDWGGAVAWWTATRNPERVSRLIILNGPNPVAMKSYLKTSASQRRHSAYIGFFQLPALPELALGAGGFALLRRTLTRSSRSGAFSADDLARYRAQWGKPGVMTAMLNWYRALRIKPRARLSNRVITPTLILWGAGDAFLERGLAEACAKMCDDARLVFLEDATHWVLHEQPDAINAAVIPFLA
ncbi:MAG: alpha/beta fold hydrolase [Caulobacteraceae bacterium]